MNNFLTDRRHRLDVIAGLIDGILNALVLTTAKLTGAGGGVTWQLAIRVGIATTVTTLFVFFVAHYAELRAELLHVERELNLMSRGKLATTRLGRQILSESALAACIAGGCGLLGSVIPLMLGIVIPGASLLSVCVTIGILGVLGMVLAWTFFGSPLKWALALMFGGAFLAWIGAMLNIAAYIRGYWNYPAAKSMRRSYRSQIVPQFGRDANIVRQLLNRGTRAP
jgi:predicted membrane protein (TIGR00267 family)